MAVGFGWMSEELSELMGEVRKVVLSQGREVIGSLDVLAVLSLRFGSESLGHAPAEVRDLIQAARSADVTDVPPVLVAFSDDVTEVLKDSIVLARSRNMKTIELSDLSKSLLAHSSICDRLEPDGVAFLRRHLDSVR